VLWAELRIFPSEQQSITAGKTVSILAGKQTFTTTIAHLLPADGDATYLVARAKLSGEGNSLFPGLMVEGRILVAEFVAPLSVANKALQSIDKKTGVFIKKGDRYIFTPLVLGRADSKFTEVRLGIDPGVEYVVENSYLIKADIEKSEAEHKH
jgi:cobalt-zinc-cadmium efflux system membrane fusion protein